MTQKSTPVSALEQAQLIYKGIKNGGSYTNPQNFDAAIDMMFSYLEKAGATVDALDPINKDSADQVKQTLERAASEGLFSSARRTEQQILGGTFQDPGTLDSAVRNMMSALKASGKTLGDLEMDPGNPQRVEQMILGGAESGLHRGAKLRNDGSENKRNDLSAIKAQLESTGMLGTPSEIVKIDTLVQHALPSVRNATAKLETPAK